MSTCGGLKSFLIAVVCLLVFRAAAEDLTSKPMEAVLAEIMAHPNYTQMCDGGMFGLEDKGVPFPIYGRLLDRSLRLTTPQILLLRARYEELVPVLKSALSNLHPEREEIEDAGRGEHSERVDQLNGLYLYIVSDCRMIEVLPELLVLEERLRAAIQHADEHPKSPTPNVAWDSWIWHPTKVSLKMSVRERDLEFCRAYQREILSLMLLLLREQKFEPLMTSDFEKRYQEGLVQQRQSAESNPAATVTDKRGVWMPFSTKARNDVRALAKQFLKTVPSEQWKRAIY